MTCCFLACQTQFVTGSIEFVRRPFNQASKEYLMATATQPTVTLKHIAADLAEKFDMPKKQMNQVMEDLVAHLVKNLKKGNRVRVAGFGILQVRKRAARM